MAFILVVKFHSNISNVDYQITFKDCHYDELLSYLKMDCFSHLEKKDDIFTVYLIN